MGYRILVLADIHADIENLLKFIREIKQKEKFDFVVSPGDFIDSLLPKYMDVYEVFDIIIEELKLLDKPLITVPGNQDGEILDELKKETYCVHGKGYVFDDIGFYGYGGARTPAKTSLEPSEEELIHALEKSYQEIYNAKYKIQVTHMPPYETKLDLLPFGFHVGSKAIRNFISLRSPTVAISAHIHEAKGVDRINNTKIINPGRFTEGNYAIAEVGETDMKIELKNLLDEMKIIV
ncbi:MAG: metallophosphoesterase [Candidatus Aenigmarchaeota archaeon]|nr:metallophosphoesterase [Candidatus Aenigmarchaeota archaeon]